MDPSSPPSFHPNLFIACVPALFAALFATATAAVASIPESRKAALSGALSGPAKTTFDRYLQSPATVESRWLALRILGVASSAVLVFQALPGFGAPARLGLSLLGVILAYGIPAEVGIALTARMPETTVPALLRLVRPFELLIAPIAAPLSLISKLVQRKRAPSASLAESEVELLVTEGELNGSLAHDQSEMIRNVLDFKDVRAGDVMVPRTQVTALDVALTADDALQLIAGTAHSRYPVFRERIDNIVGILHVKDVMAYAASNDIRSMRIEDLMRTPVVFVPESQSASSVLMDMRSVRRHHMAIIIDEFGGMSGIITLEDIIEEIVGDIQDEHDDEEPPIVDLGDGRLMVDAAVGIDDLSRYLGVELPEDGDYSSLGGFIVERIGQVPEVGTVITDYGLDFVVRDADERHVAKVEIVRQAPTDSVPPPQSSSRRSERAA